MQTNYRITARRELHRLVNSYRDSQGDPDGPEHPVSSMKQDLRVLRYVLTGTRRGRTRIDLLRALAETPRSVTELAEHLDLKPASVRHHLAVLRDNGIVTGEAGSRYRLTERTVRHRETLEEYIGTLEHGVK